jgi:hypothetical protein
MATIHGPDGWHDVIDTKAGHTVAVCPKACFARRIASLLTESHEGDVRIDLGPAAGGGR